ncbi:DUF4468 domain-containing protein [Chryseobacterium sp. H1D6B]|uniref:DUF4468 domain-containing protein n=1 Tax=Chryseobacterium sp. H1D6B TaxID=2940588 RepID=UPI0015CC3417|nr:DUF4468 domain-containing protein [Chryseobacterium sp. H1D6B]
MKKLLNIIILMIFSQSFSAQYFRLTPQGFVSDNKSDYVVIDVPNTKQKDLYRNVLNALSTMYKDPKNVLSTVEGESITVKGYEEKKIPHKYKLNPLLIGKATMKYDVSYTLNILFKDNKIRFNSPSFECRRWYEGNYKSGWDEGWTYLTLMKDKNYRASIYDKNGEITSEESYTALNNHFNALIKEILEKSKKINNW